MARFLVKLCKYSDHELACRSYQAERHYEQALRLIKQAGFKYSPPEPKIVI